MKVDFKKLPASKIELSVSLTADEFKPYWEEAKAAAISKVNLKGFRPGAAPKEMAEKAINPEAAFDEALRHAIRVTLDQASQENSWVLIDAPKIEVLDAKEGVSYKAMLTVFPEVKIGNYKKTAAKVFGEKIDVAVKPEEIQKSLEWLQKNRAAQVRVSRAAQKGDLVEVKIESRLDGKLLPDAQLDEDKFVLGESRFIPGFDEQLENHKEGETLNFSLTAPKDYWNSELREKKLDFQVLLKSVYEMKAAELNDDFAKNLGGKFQGVEDLKKSIQEGLAQEKTAREKEKRQIKALEEIVKGSEMEIPEVMVEKTLDSMIADYRHILEKTGQKEEDLRKNLRERAQQQVAGNLVIYDIAQKEGLKPTPEEIEKELEALSTRAGQKIDGEKYYNYIYGVIQNKKVFEFLEKQTS